MYSLVFDLPPSCAAIIKDDGAEQVAGPPHISDTIFYRSRFTTWLERHGWAKAAIRAAKQGENHPMYGRVGHTALGVSVYTLDNVLVEYFASRDSAAIWLECSDVTVTNIFALERYLKESTLLLIRPKGHTPPIWSGISTNIFFSSSSCIMVRGFKYDCT
jgi:hypothetical protein